MFVLVIDILEDFENASPYFCFFLQTVYAIEKLLAGFSVQPRFGMNQSLIGVPRGFGDLGRMAIYFQGAGEHC